MFLKKIAKIKSEDDIIRNLFFHFLVIAFFSILAGSYVFSRVIFGARDIYHLVLQLLCIFVALSIFFVIWHTFKSGSTIFHIAAFAFLTAAFFNILHVYYLYFYPLNAYDLPIRYGILTRFMEAVALLIISKKFFNIKFNKWIGLGFTGIISTSFYFINNIFMEHYLFLDAQGFTSKWVSAHFIIIILLSIALYNLIKKVKSKGVLAYRYIFIALLLSILAEVFFILHEGINTTYMATGYILRVFFYYYLFRGIFVSAISYPYEKLERSNRYLSSILNSLPIGMMTYNDNGIEFVNKKGFELLGDANDNLFENPSIVKDIIASADNQTVAINDKKLNIEVFNLDNDGKLLLLFDAKEQQKLKRLQFQTQTILNSINNLVLLVDEDDIIINCNEAFANSVSIQVESVKGKRLQELFEELRLHIKDDFTVACQEKGRLFEASLITKNNTKLDLIGQSAEIVDVDGKILGCIFIASDVTDLKSEQELLQQQEKLALLGQMAAGIIHEIKNPLTVIKGLSQLIRGKINDQHMRKQIKKIEEEAENINDFVSDFLNLAKPQDYPEEIFSLNELIGSLSWLFESKSLTKGVKVNIEVKASNIWVRSNKNQIKQVILNIFKNSLEAVSEINSPEIIIAVDKKIDENKAYIIIRDNGVGIAEDELSRLGQPFFTTKKNGTGLGVNICKQIIKEHGGRISFESKINKGTTASIILPLARE